MFLNLFDSHSHSENSPDGEHSVTFMAESSVEKGVHGLAVTDHCECDRLETFDFQTRIRQSALDVAIAKAAFRYLVILTTGIELDNPGYDLSGAEDILTMQNYDMVLLSLQRLQGYEPFCLTDFGAMSEKSVHVMLEQYFEELLSLITWGRFDVLAHLAFPLRHIMLHHGVDIDPQKYIKPLDAVLSALIKNGKGLEVNTFGLAGPERVPLPSEWVVRRYRELGGELVTLGSGAHLAQDIGRGINEGMRLLLDAGYTHFAFYRHREPIMLRII